MKINLIKEALLIRRSEELLLKLFREGKLSGTVHTCVGQEMGAVCVLEHICENDYVFSNHRCHGHFISYSKDPKSLILELVGKKAGVCSGFGGSQHLQYKNFFSNGIQGGMVPIALGTAFGQKLKNDNGISIVFIGDGTLGQGVVYESMNMASLFGAPMLIVCEDNRYAQSTHSSLSMAGDMLDRPKAFGLEVFEGNTSFAKELSTISGAAIDYVRTTKKPAFLRIKTNRLNPHSKGDDFRGEDELVTMASEDFLNVFASKNKTVFDTLELEVENELKSVLEEIDDAKEASVDDFLPKRYVKEDGEFVACESMGQRVVDRLNLFFKDVMQSDEKTLFIGEDVLSPYGGAFKVARDLSDMYPARVITTPISEQAISGMSNGLAISGYKPYLEIMFGDFITLALDQIINHASKFNTMFNQKINCGVKIRTPMGGGRGYGATHSQSLERFLLGIDGTTALSLNNLVDPYLIYSDVHTEPNPVVVFEYKSLYGEKIGRTISGYKIMRQTDKYPQATVLPIDKASNLTVVTYGESSKKILDLLHELFFEFEIVCDVYVLSQIHPIKDFEFLRSLKCTKKLLTLEEGNPAAGFGSEIIALANNRLDIKFKSEKLGAQIDIIPAQKNIEKEILINKNSVFSAVKRLFDV